MAEFQRLLRRIPGHPAIDKAVEHHRSMTIAGGDLPEVVLKIGGHLIVTNPVTWEQGGEGMPPDWRDLEYHLLFLFKNAGEYGINFANGYYFRFEQEGDRLIDTRFEADMDQMASPPPGDVRYPLDETELYLSEGDGHRLLRLIIAD